MTGRRIAHYRILEKLGEGGMGVVYKAEDTKLGRIVALKFPPSDSLGSQEEKQRFLHEARAAAALDHPNISTIYEINEDDSEIYISMAFIDGLSLREKIDQGPLKIETALDTAIQIAEGLKAAHDKGVIHRDIKSANIMFTQSGQAKITDFGLAKLAGSRDKKEKSTMGTVAYMSPEQTRGEDVDERSDIWSLGVVMYEMLSGLRPFRGDYEQSVIYAIVNEEPEPLTAIRTGVPMKFERIVTKALTKNANNRYKNVDDVLTDLKALKADLDSKELLLRSGVRMTPRRRASMFAVPTVILTVAVIMVLGSYLRSGLQEAEGAQIPIAVADFDNATQEEGLDGLSGMLITALEQSRRLSVLTRSSMFDVLQRMGKENVERIDESLGREICIEANIRVLVVASINKFDDLYTIDLKVFEMGRPEHLFTAREEGVGRSSIPGMIDRIAQKTRKGLKEKTDHIRATSEPIASVTTPNLEAYQNFFRGEQLIEQLRYKEAQSAYQKAIELDSTFALANYRLAYANWWGGESEKIQRAQLQKALSLIDRLPERFRYLLRAQNAVNAESYERGIEILKEMEAIYPDDKEMIYNIGDFSFHAGLFEQAEAYLRRALEAEPNSQRALNHLTMTYTAMGDPVNAIETGRKYAELAETDYAYLTLSNAYLSNGNTDDALRVVENARDDMPDNPWIRRQIATVKCMNDEFTAARAILDSLVTETDDLEVERMAYYSLMGANLYMGRYHEALENADHNLTLASEKSDTVAIVFGRQKKSIIYLWGWNDRENAAVEFEAARTLYEVTNPVSFGKYEQDYWGNVMAYYFLSGQSDKARAIAENRLKEKPDRRDRFSFFRLWALGDYEGAKAAAREVLAGNKERDKTMVLYYLSKTQMEHGDYELALESLQDLQDRRHYSGSRAIFYVPSYYLLGWTHEQRGDTKSAIESYERFVALWKEADPDLPLLSDAKTRLSSLKKAATQ